MQTSYKRIEKRLMGIIIACIIFILLTTTIIMAFETDNTCLTPMDNQYFELRAVQVNEVEGQNKQVIMELWGNNIEFKGFDVRFSYDSANIQPSNISNNEITSDGKKFFEFESEFKESLDFFNIQYDKEGNGILGTLSFNPPITESEHVIEKKDIGYVVNTDGGVLLGKMSFQMTADEFDVNWFKLETNDDSYPHTGIKINIDGINNYQAQSTFRFTEQLASKNADLSNIVLSSGIKNEANPEQSTYKEYSYTPVFEKDTLNYTYELLEYVDNMDITAMLEDEKSSMKIKIPKRDEDNNLVYESDEITITYEEKEILSNIPLEVTLNKLGEPDTKLTIIVTAEDGTTTKEYTMTIKRPYGTVKGSIKLGETLREKAQISNGIYVEYIADIKAYKSGEFIWEDILTETTNYSVLDAMPILNQVQSDKDDGSFELFLIPGTYDVFMEKLGFTQVVNKQIIINESDVIDLGENILHEGDVNRDGIVDITDLTTIVRQNGEDSSDPSGSYSEKYDFQKKGYIDITDITSVSSSLKKRKELVINNLGNI